MKGNNVRALRAYFGWSQAKAARFLNISPTAYKQKETGVRPFTLNEAYKLAKVANKNIEEIFFTDEVTI